MSRAVCSNSASDYSTHVFLCNPSFFVYLLDYHDELLLYPLFSLEKKGFINFVSKSVRRPSVRLSVRPSVCPSVRPCVRPSVTFLVNVSPPKPLEVATSNFVGE